MMDGVEKLIYFFFGWVQFPLTQLTHRKIIKFPGYNIKHFRDVKQYGKNIKK